MDKQSSSTYDYLQKKYDDFQSDVEEKNKKFQINFQKNWIYILIFFLLLYGIMIFLTFYFIDESYFINKNDKKIHYLNLLRTSFFLLLSFLFYTIVVFLLTTKFFKHM